MPRASYAQRAERRDRARTLLGKKDPLSDLVEQMAKDCSISRRQARRYLEQARRPFKPGQHLKEPALSGEATLTFSVRLRHSLIQRVRAVATTKRLPISKVVSKALLAWLPRGGPSSAAIGPKEIDAQTLKQLATIQATQEDMAGYFEMSPRQFRRRIREDSGLKDTITFGRAKGRIAIRRKQFEIMNGDGPGAIIAAIWLGKNVLGQRSFARDPESPNDKGKGPGLVIQTYGPGQNNPRDPQSAPPELEVGTSNMEHLDLHMMPSFEIPGELRFEDEKAKQAYKTVTEGPQGSIAPGVALQRILLPSTAQSEIGADDSFKLEKVQPGQYRVELRGSGGAYVRSIRLGAVEVDGDILDLRNGSGGGSLTLLVSAATCEISGTVSDSDGPVAGAMVEIAQDESSFFLGMVTDSSGKYSRTGLRPGKYKLLAVDEKTVNMQDYDDLFEAVELHAGDKVTKDLNQIRR
jgi:hypothetical protein